MTLDTKNVENWTVYIRRAHWVVATDEKGSGLSQPSDFELRAKKHPAPEFAKEAEKRQATKPAEDDNSFAVHGPWNWRIESKGPWLQKWGGLVAFALAITAVAVAVMLWKGF